MLFLAYLSVGNTQFLFQAEFKKELSVVIYLSHFVLISEVFLLAIVPAYLYKIGFKQYETIDCMNGKFERPKIAKLNHKTLRYKDAKIINIPQTLFSTHSKIHVNHDELSPLSLAGDACICRVSFLSTESIYFDNHDELFPLLPAGDACI